MVELRCAQLSDSDFLYGLRNSDAVRRASVSTAWIPRPSHERWLAASLADPSMVIYVIEVDGEAAGSLRLDLDGEDIRVSIALASGFRGRGLGQAAIGLAAERCHLHGRRFVALVRKENIPSHRAFLRAGFVPVPGGSPPGDEFLLLEKGYKAHG